ncbi:hypothetical protein L484_014116 [Morus notabilis]|uniref:Uncharacterized protein n=1 Tax=Morus notabilis TaxID=981085 RepID=W9SNW9_9ROSA|nr:hypothetical protein L484_014116 [Morus notabilis]
MSSENELRQLRFSDDREKLDGFRLFDTENPQDVKNAANLHSESDQKRLQHEPKYNVRKSLAWDSAFFTSPGVLEPEELFGTVNSQFVDNLVDIFGHEEEILFPSRSLEPKITSSVDKCDLRKSLAWDSAFFTNAGVLDPEELSIVNRGFKNSGTYLPGILEDVLRSNESNYSVDSGSSSLTSLEIDLFEDMRESSFTSTNKLSVSAPSLKFRSIKVRLSTLKFQVKDMPTSRRQNSNPHGAERCKKKASLSAPSLKQLPAGSGELNLPSFLRPPKSSDQIKNTPKGLPKRAPLGASLVKARITKSASGQCLNIPKKPSTDNLNSVSCCSTPSPKSSSLCFLTATHESVSCSLSNSGSTFKTPLKKAELGSSCHSSYVFSCPSPDSSFEGWSSESSSTSAIEKSNNPQPKENGNQGKRLLKHHIKKAPLGTGALPFTELKNTKPSGLRMPSPKIGYFDEENSSIATTVESAQFNPGTQSAMSKVGSGISVLNRPANRAKNGKPKISGTISGTPKQIGPESALQITSKNPTKDAKVQNTSGNEHVTRATIEICFPMALRVKKDLPLERTSKDCLETKKVDSKGQDAAIEGIRSSSKAESECDEGSMKNKFGRKHKNLNEYEEHMNCPGKNLRIHNDSDKENVYSFKEQVDGLSKYVGTIDLGGDMVIELKVNKTSSHSQSAVLTLKI